MNRLNRYLLKRAMKLVEVKPTKEETETWSTIFESKAFIYASPEEQERIMFKSSKLRYDHEHQAKEPFAQFFGIDIAPFIKGKVILDLGCFTGGRSVAWQEIYQPSGVYGIDIDDSYIEAARRFAESKNIDAKFDCAFGEYLPYQADKFDAILSWDVFEHVQDLNKVMEECKRVLKPGGKLLVAFPSFYNPIEHHLSAVTRTPFIHYIWKVEDLVAVYNEIIKERGEWYARGALEDCEKGNTINGTSKMKFRQIIKGQGWKVVHENRTLILCVEGAWRRLLWLKRIWQLLTPLIYVPVFEEALCNSIVYILEKPCNK